MQLPQRLVRTVRLPDHRTETLLGLRPELLTLRRQVVVVQLHASGWDFVPVEHVAGRIYITGGEALLVALHRPRSLDAVLVGGVHDGTVVPLSCEWPPLTIGVEPVGAWSCWQYAGVQRDSSGWWRWAYIPAQAKVCRAEQDAHDAGRVHKVDGCGLCTLARWIKTSSPLALPDRIRPDDAALYGEAAPHATTLCTACMAIGC
ncbi:hypothetical protein ACFQ36_07055 [Arthrobacter sp. GCM10027362]|uniref:hypothetical protein n=1 Tax=Arthrobacter sp. GCM10027362 TaxID=3273379 RepID=UPI00364426FC